MENKLEQFLIQPFKIYVLFLYVCVCVLMLIYMYDTHVYSRKGQRVSDPLEEYGYRQLWTSWCGC